MRFLFLNKDQVVFFGFFFLIKKNFLFLIKKINMFYYGKIENTDKQTVGGEAKCHHNI